jgi:hypothetical protein
MQTLPRSGAILLTASLVFFADAPPAAAVDCHAAPVARQSGWVWRQIDGRRCWFKGAARTDKRLLQWAKATPREVAPRPETQGRATPTIRAPRSPTSILWSPTPPPFPQPFPLSFEQRWCDPCIRGADE